MAIEIKDNPDESRYEAHLDGELAGIADYDLTDGTIVFTHTKVEVEDEGVGSALVRGALDDVRRRGGLRVVPQCPFFESWIDKHPDYADLVSA